MRSEQSIAGIASRHPPAALARRLRTHHAGNRHPETQPPRSPGRRRGGDRVSRRLRGQSRMSEISCRPNSPPSRASARALPQSARRHPQHRPDRRSRARAFGPDSRTIRGHVALQHPHPARPGDPGRRSHRPHRGASRLRHVLSRRAASTAIPRARLLRERPFRGLPATIAVIHPFAVRARKDLARRATFSQIAAHLREHGLDPVFIAGPGDDPRRSARSR